MRVMINGEERELQAETTVASVVGSFGGAPEGRGIAVALKGEVIPRSAWEITELIEGDQLEIVVAVQGG
jgi:sulfur carrier protein